jgi:hypothetical protein
MATDPALAKPVTPRPGLPRAIGMLNLAFGGMFFFCGLRCLSVYGPAIDQYRVDTLDAESAQGWYEGLRTSLVADLRRREDEAADPAERGGLRARREALEAERPRIADQIDLPAYNAGVRWMTWYLWADIITAPVLNLLMFASGMGLLQLRVWARRMGIWVAALKIARLVALTVFSVLVVIPRASPMMESFLASDLGRVWVESKMAAQNANRAVPAPQPEVDPKQLAPTLPGFSKFMAVVMLGLGVIYPAISLAILSHPSARAACDAAEEADGEDDEGEAPW